MATVDEKGRIVIPSDIRERLDLHAGSDVDVHTTCGSVVIEPAEDTAQFVSDHVSLIEEIAAKRDNRRVDREESLSLEDDPIAAHHREVIKRRAQSADDDDSVEHT